MSSLEAEPQPRVRPLPAIAASQETEPVPDAAPSAHGADLAADLAKVAIGRDGAADSGSPGSPGSPDGGSPDGDGPDGDPATHPATLAAVAGRVKRLIVENLHLDGLRPEMIDEQAPLFGDGLGLDSVDALELVVAVEKDFGIKIKSNEIGRDVFSSVASLSRFIAGRI